MALLPRSKAVQPKVFLFIRNYCHHFPGVYLKGIGGTRDHLHAAIEIEPKVVIDQMIGKIKGACARAINKEFSMKMLRWQRGYGVVSFATANLPAILKYIELQEQNHANGTTREKLEDCGDMGTEEDLDEEE